MNDDARLAVALNLARIYRDVLGEPVPEPLAELLKRLQDRNRRSGP
jgi:hypothetical protein